MLFGYPDSSVGSSRTTHRLFTPGLFPPPWMPPSAGRRRTVNADHRKREEHFSSMNKSERYAPVGETARAAIAILLCFDRPMDLNCRVAQFGGQLPCFCRRETHLSLRGGVRFLNGSDADPVRTDREAAAAGRYQRKLVLQVTQKTSWGPTVTWGVLPSVWTVRSTVLLCLHASATTRRRIPRRASAASD